VVQARNDNDEDEKDDDGGDDDGDTCEQLVWGRL